MPASVGAAAAGPIPAAVRAPWLTTSSGWSNATGAIPNARFNTVATNGIRLDPPTSSTP
jgi:hypothetical protein